MKTCLSRWANSKDITLIQAIFDLQRAIYPAVGANITEFAAGGGWLGLFAVLSMGVVFGTAHALTPGHSKALLAAYVARSPIGVSLALLASLTLSFTHITIAILIALFSLPFVSIAFGRVGRAPALETVSRGLLGFIGAWMVW